MHSLLDAYCEDCLEPGPHEVRDPGSCACARCGRVVLLVEPLSQVEVEGLA